MTSPEQAPDSSNDRPAAGSAGDRPSTDTEFPSAPRILVAKGGGLTGLLVGVVGIWLLRSNSLPGQVLLVGSSLLVGYQTAFAVRNPDLTEEHGLWSFGTSAFRSRFDVLLLVVGNGLLLVVFLGLALRG